MHVQVTLANVVCMRQDMAHYHWVIVCSLGRRPGRHRRGLGMFRPGRRCRLTWIRPDVIPSQLHTDAKNAWGASGGPLPDSEPRGASGGRSQGASPQPVAVANASRTGWPWLEAAVEMAWRSCGSLPSAPSAQSLLPAPPVLPPLAGSDWRGGVWSTVPRVATRTPAPTTRSIGTARAFTLRTMNKWGVVARGADVAAVVTELMTNALRHALRPLPDDSTPPSGWPIRLGLVDPGPYVICAVADPSATVPVRRHADWHDEAGRGLLVVAALSDQWGYCTAPSDQGKVVWAAFAATSRSI